MRLSTMLLSLITLPLFSIKGYSQKDFPIQSKFQHYPDIGFNWEVYYGNESYETIDSLYNWLQRHNNTITAPSISLLIANCGNKFFRLKDDIIIEELKNAIYGFKPEDTIGLESWRVRLEPEMLKYPKWHHNWVSDIWEDDIYFYYNAERQTDYSNFRKVAAYHLKRIQKLDTIYDVTYGLLVPNFNDVYNGIVGMEDEEDNFKVVLLFYLMEKLYELRATQYFTHVTYGISQICYSSSTISLDRKAEFYVGCAKALATVDSYSYGYEITSYLNYAEGFLFIQNDPYHLDIFRNIKAKYLMSLPGQYGCRLSIFSVKEDLKSPSLSPAKTFEKEVLITNALLQIAIETQNGGRAIPDELTLSLLNHLGTAIGIYQDLPTQDWFELNINPQYPALLFTCISDYYFYIVGDKTNAIDYQLSSLHHDFMNFGEYHDFEDREKLKNNIWRIAYKLSAVGDSAEAAKWLNIFYLRRTEKDIENYKKQLPVNLSYLTNAELDNYSDSLQQLDLTILNSYRGIEIINKKDNLEAELQYIAAYLHEKQDWEGLTNILYKFIEVSDASYDIEYYSTFMAYSSYYRELAEKTQLYDSIASARRDLKQLTIAKANLENNNSILKSERDSLVSDTIALFYSTKRLDSLNVIKGIELNQKQYKLDSTIKVIGEVEEARREAVFYMRLAVLGGAMAVILAFVIFIYMTRYRLLSYSNNQLSHFAKKVPLILGYRLQEAILNKLKPSGEEVIRGVSEKLISLSAFFETFYDKSNKGKLQLNEELSLIMKLVDIEYNNNNSKDFVINKVKVNVDGVERIRIPTFSMFNIVYNSFRWGDIGNRDNGEVVLSFKTSFFRHAVTIVDNGAGPSQPKGKRGTGMVYSRRMIKFNNAYIFRSVVEGKRKDGQPGYETSFSLLKRIKLWSTKSTS